MNYASAETYGHGTRLLGFSAEARAIDNEVSRFEKGYVNAELAAIYRLHAEGRAQAAAQRLLLSLEADLHAGNMARADHRLAALDVTRVGPAALIAATTITSYAHDRLDERADFLMRAEQHLIQTLGAARALSLLATRR